MEDADIIKGNLDFTTAVIIAGGTYLVVQNMNLQTLSKSTFCWSTETCFFYKLFEFVMELLCRYVSAFVYPLMDQSFYANEKNIQQTIFEEQTNDPILALSLTIDTNLINETHEMRC